MRTKPEQSTPTTWVLLADEGRARVLERRGDAGDLVVVEQWTDDAARADEADLRSGPSGRRAGGGAAGGRGAGSGGQLVGHMTDSAGASKLEHEAERFAQRAIEYLQQAQAARRFDALIVAAAPKFLGRLRPLMPPQVAALIRRELDKDLLQLDARTLTERLFAE
jgi:protein required for attachment to host cells